MIAYDVRVAVPSLNVRKDASVKTDVVKTVKSNDTFQIVEEKDGFGRLDDKSGWVMLEFVERIDVPQTKETRESEVVDDGEFDKVIEDEE